MEQNELKHETKEENRAKVENAKRDFYEENLRNKRIVRVLKGLVYAVTGIMFALGMLTFVTIFIMDKDWINSDITIPVVFILFGIDAILLTQINRRISKTNSLKGDIVELIVGICAVVLGIIWLILSIIG